MKTKRLVFRPVARFVFKNGIGYKMVGNKIVAFDFETSFLNNPNPTKSSHD